TFEAIHWHNDMPGLTQDAVILATSKGCPRQIIRYNSRTYGFQCHLEISKDGIEAMIKNCPDDLTPQKFVQDKTKLLQKNYAHINTQMFSILDQWAQLFIIGARVAPIIDQWKIGHEFGEHIVEIILTGKTFRNNPE
ncbi:MAG: hypothetical protein KDC83_14635, partial [Flavobacteriales bacterium]|nr:hypothetical protein [Flavobacteriales bacterium]